MYTGTTYRSPELCRGFNTPTGQRNVRPTEFMAAGAGAEIRVAHSGRNSRRCRAGGGRPACRGGRWTSASRHRVLMATFGLEMHVPRRARRAGRGGVTVAVRRASRRLLTGGWRDRFRRANNLLARGRSCDVLALIERRRSMCRETARLDRVARGNWALDVQVDHAADNSGFKGT
jgi:hypothetical protein